MNASYEEGIAWLQAEAVSVNVKALDKHVQFCVPENNAP